MSQNASNTSAAHQLKFASSHLSLLSHRLGRSIALGGAEDAPNTDRADACIWALSDLMLTERFEPRVRML